MKKKLLTLLVSAAGIVSLSSCIEPDKKTIKVNSGSLDNATYSEESFSGVGYGSNDYFSVQRGAFFLQVGGTEQIPVKTFPNLKNEELVFTSKNPSIAKVDASGIIEGVAKGYTDIVVSTKDGSASNLVRAVVTTSDSDAVARAIAHNKGIYNDPEYVSPTKVIHYEYSRESYTCEGVLDHGSEEYEVMGYDANEGYFFLEGPFMTYKTPHGQPELNEGKWIFYPINYGVKTRMIHITPTRKTFYDLNTGGYETNDRRIRDILNFLFVSGEKILDNLIDDLEYKDAFLELVDLSSTKFYGVSDTALVMEYIENGSDTVDADDEINAYDIPAETPYDYTFTIKALNEDAKVRANITAQNMRYTRDGKKWVRSFERSKTVDDNFEYQKIQNPKENGYTEVDSWYDL